MEFERSLRRSIVISTITYLCIQIAAYLAALGPARAMAARYVWFIPVALVVHAGIAVFLFVRRADLRHTGAGEALTRLNAAIHLTLFRLSCAPLILLLSVGVRYGEVAGVILVVVAGVAFVTDFFDGQVARRLNQTTEMGRYLDSSTDYAVLVVLAVAFVVMRVTPVWYFSVLIARLIGFAVAMLVLARVQGHPSPETTFLGKAAVFSAMATYGFEICRYTAVPGLGDPTVVSIVEVVSAAILLASVVDKVLYLVRKFRALTS